MRKINCLFIILLLTACISKSKENPKTQVYLSLDYERVNNEVAKVWINDTLKFCRIFYYDYKSLCGIIGMKVDRVNKGNVKLKIELTNLDRDYYFHKRVVDTTFYYNTSRYDAIKLTYLRINSGFRVYNNVDNPEEWEVE